MPLDSNSVCHMRAKFGDKADRSTKVLSLLPKSEKNSSLFAEGKNFKLQQEGGLEERSGNEG